MMGPVDGHAPPKRATEHELLADQLETLGADLHRLDPLARADLPDAVHQLRTRCRRLRALLTTFAKCFDDSATQPVLDDLSWISQVLGRPRDLEVLRETYGRLFEAEPVHLVRGLPAPWIDNHLRALHGAAHRDAVDAMDSVRYYTLLDTLDAWRTAPPWADERDRPAERRLGRALDQQWKRMERAVAAVTADDSENPPNLLHDVRKAARRTRYAAEVLAPLLGSNVRRTAKAAKRIQRVLGRHHDAVVAGEHLIRLSDSAHVAGRDTFTFGVLSVRLEAEKSVHERAFQQVWGKAREASRRGAKRVPGA
jgi:CHAD domain-containing protein